MQIHPQFQGTFTIKSPSREGSPVFSQVRDIHRDLIQLNEPYHQWPTALGRKLQFIVPNRLDEAYRARLEALDIRYKYRLNKRDNGDMEESLAHSQRYFAYRKREVVLENLLAEKLKEDPTYLDREMEKVNLDDIPAFEGLTPARPEPDEELN